MGLTEAQIVDMIDRLTARATPSSVRLGIGDDTALLRPFPAQDMVVTTDQVIENTHFKREGHPPQALGHKTLARGLSDIAAMGGLPNYFLLSLCLPAWAAVRSWLKQYLAGMLRLSSATGTTLVGGDVARGDRFVANVTVIGSVPKGSALLRSGARAGDILYVSGRLGGSLLGLEKLRGGESRGAAARRHLYPQPRLALGRFLRTRLKATAALDLSDGLSTDLRRLVQASGVGAELDASRIPRFQGASLAQALHGGEEYELLFSVSPSANVPARFEKIPLTAIGRIRRLPGVLLRANGDAEELRPEGFEHFLGGR